ncbi:MAG: ATP-binding cassette domain-containing protein [Planctomycetota bacterium]
MRVSLDRLVRRPEQPLFGGALTRRLGPGLNRLLHPDRSVARTAQAMARAHGFDVLDTPWSKLTAKQRDLVMDGTGDRAYEVVLRKTRGSSVREYALEERWPGLRPLLEERLAQTGSASAHEQLASVLAEEACPTCGGSRLSPAVLGVRLGGEHIGALSRRTVADLRAFLAGLGLAGEEAVIGREVLRELDQRLGFLEEMGLGYLAIDRKASTLSGGEAQRIRLASQLGSRLTGTLYVLDEPTVGLHPRDTERLLGNLEGLRDLGNTVVAVEHDPQVLGRADWIVDLGPEAGRGGGRVVYQGEPAGLAGAEGHTADWVAGRRTFEARDGCREPKGFVQLGKVRTHNLRGIDARFPLGCLTAVTGVSGSGKSSLVIDSLVPALRGEDGPWKLTGRGIEELVVVDQDPVGTTPRSCPVTYTGIWTPIRELFAKTEDARRLGFGPSRFLFNGGDGACPTCEGRGELLIEMHFLADVWVTCDLCKGRRYDAATLEVRWKGRTIADVLRMEAREAVEFFAAQRRIARVVRTLVDVGLGYLELGQGVHTLSGGEAQRLKLAAELCKPPRPGLMYVLDEPTTGLDPQARERLWDRLLALEKRDKTLVLTTHAMDEAERLCDRLVVMDGGRIVAEGAPAALVREHVPPFVVEVRLDEGAAFDEGAFAGLVERWRRRPDRVLLYGRDGEGLIHRALELWPGQRAALRPSDLEDVFLVLTGHGLEA